jgi:hypothetical protein
MLQDFVPILLARHEHLISVRSSGPLCSNSINRSLAIVAKALSSADTLRRGVLDLGRVVADQPVTVRPIVSPSTTAMASALIGSACRLDAQKIENRIAQVRVRRFMPSAPWLAGDDRRRVINTRIDSSAVLVEPQPWRRDPSPKQTRLPLTPIVLEIIASLPSPGRRQSWPLRAQASALVQLAVGY